MNKLDAYQPRQKLIELPRQKLVGQEITKLLCGDRYKGVAAEMRNKLVGEMPSKRVLIDDIVTRRKSIDCAARQKFTGPDGRPAPLV